MPRIMTAAKIAYKSNLIIGMIELMLVVYHKITIVHAVAMHSHFYGRAIRYVEISR